MESLTPLVAFREAALPSMVYAFQGILNTMAAKYLDGVIFNVLNQTKLLFTAFFVLVFCGKRQSQRQCLGLFLIFVASVLTLTENNAQRTSTMCTKGVAAAIAGAMLSGLGAVLSEVVLVGKQRNSLLFCAELAVGGVVTVGLILLLDLNGDGSKWSADGSLFALWTPATWLPVSMNAAGGILVGVLTKALGSVRKAVAITAGVLLAATLQAAADGQLPSPSLCCGIVLVAIGVRLHCTNPIHSTESLELPCITQPRGKVTSSVEVHPSKDAHVWVEAYLALPSASCRSTFHFR
jgi:UDP-sugar transporter A1/2/3